MNEQEFDFSVDLLRELLWQYNNAPALESLITSKQAWYTENQTEFWESWIRDVFDLRTANDFGLSVWAVILGVPLVVTPEPDADKFAWGYGPDRANYNNGNFAANGGSFGLTTEQKRLVLRLRYFQLVTRGAAPEVNAFLATVFGPGVVYMADTGGMRIAYIFNVAPDAAVELVLTQLDILPRPAAVGVGLVVANPAARWGFGRYRQNYNNGNFAPVSAQNNSILDFLGNTMLAFTGDYLVTFEG